MTATATLEQIKALREKTGLGVIECKKALDGAGGDFAKALELLKLKGIQIAEKKESRETKEGLVGSYVHTNGKIGVLIEVTCESDFVARTDDFKELVKNLTLQIAASSPEWITKEDVPAAVLKERGEGVLKEKVLFCQSFIRDDSLTIEDYVKSRIAKVGENIKVTRFARFQLGEQ